MINNNDLYIDLSKIVKSDGASIEVLKTFPAEIFLEMDNTINLTSPVTIIGRVSNLASNLTIDGTLKFSVAYECDRCLEPFTQSYEVLFVDDIAKDDSMRDKDEYIPYSNNRVLLTDAIYKAIFSETSGTRHFCKPDCKGLCNMCGCDLNKNECDCSDEEIDPRLLKLKDFFA